MTGFSAGRPAVLPQVSELGQTELELKDRQEPFESELFLQYSHGAASAALLPVPTAMVHPLSTTQRRQTCAPVV